MQTWQCSKYQKDWALPAAHLLCPEKPFYCALLAMDWVSSFAIGCPSHLPYPVPSFGQEGFLRERLWGDSL